MAITAKITAREMREGVPTTIVCIEEDGTELENGKITFYKNGVKLKGCKPDLTDLPYADPDIVRMVLFLFMREESSHSWYPKTGSIESFLVALDDMYFDSKPELEIEGDVSTSGSGYSDEDTTGVVF